jgi:prephenate dehydrogenase
MEYNPESIAVYSVGLLGGSLCAGLRESGYKGRIIGLSSAKSIKTALSLGIIDEGTGYDDIENVVSQVECIFLCSPINAIIETIKKLGKIKLRDGLIITDVGSTKSIIMSCAESCLTESVTFIGGHPMAGSEKSGVGASDPFLFQNAMYILTASETSRTICMKFAAFIEKYLGCNTMIMDPSEHDTIVAAVSHVPHILAVALVNLAQKAENRRQGTLKLAAGGFRDMTRIASAPYDLWHDILSTNIKAIMPLMDEYTGILDKMKSDLANNSLGASFASASRTRSGIPSGNKGFIRPYFDILVVVKDHPGMIATMSAELAKEEINIKDIEVLKVREGEGGTIRMAFESIDTAKKAVTLLNTLGFSARERD